MRKHISDHLGVVCRALLLKRRDVAVDEIIDHKKVERVCGKV